MKQKGLWGIVFVIVLALAACSGAQTEQAAPASVEVKGEKVSVSGGEYTNISVNELQTMFEDKDFLFVNVHIPFEGDIPKTDVSIPFDQVEQNLDKLPADKDAKIVLYCRSGRMSAIASETLVGLGYTNVWNLEGGMVDWERAGLQLEGR